MKQTDLLAKIQEIGKPVFTIKELRRVFPHDAHINISISRLLGRSQLLQVTKGVYALNQASIDIDRLATQLYYPSYISFESALARHGILNQGPYGLTLATLRHTKRLLLSGVECSYTQLKSSLFSGFELVNSSYLALPEKAVLDELYIRPAIDTTEWNLEGLDAPRLQALLEGFPASVKQRVKKMRAIQ